MSTLIFGVRIKLKDKDNPITQDTSIGLWNVIGANSELRWTQNTVTSLISWNPNMLIRGGIGAFTREIDLRYGGTIAVPGACTIKVHNVHNLKKLLIDKNIYLPGLRCEILEFNNNVPSLIWSGECQAPQFTSTEVTILVKRIHQNRISNLATVINETQHPNSSQNNRGKIIPITYGKFIPEFETSGEKINNPALAKAVRVLDAVDTSYYSDAFFTGSEYTDTKSFPIEVTVTDQDGNPGFRFAVRGEGGVNRTIDFSPDNTYAKIVDGTGKNQIRKVRLLKLNIGDSFVTVYPEDYFETEVQDDDTDGARSWVQLIKIYRRYDCDTFTCGGFYNKDGLLLQNGPELYTYTDEDGFSRIAPYGYEFQGVDNLNNKITIDPKLFDQGNIDTQNSFLISPVQRFIEADTDNLSDWNSDEVFWSTLNKHPSYNGYYSSSSFGSLLSSKVFLDKENVSDKDESTYCTQTINGSIASGSYEYYKVLLFNLPPVPEEFTFSNVYLGLKMVSNCAAGAYPPLGDEGFIRAMFRKFKYGVKIVPFDGVDEVTYPYLTIDNIPDFYYTTGYESGNKNFFYLQEDSHLMTGINNQIFDTGITSKEEYESYLQGGLFFKRSGSSAFPFEWTDRLQLFELCIIFKKSSDIKTNLYTPFAGRTFDDSFHSRKTGTAVISSPVDVLEHVCRLQNFTDTDINEPLLGWGKQLPTGVLPIKEIGDGSFDSDELDDIRGFEIARQITEYDDGYSDQIKKSICKGFNIANWVDTNGNECLRRIKTITPSPSDLVTINNIMDRTSVKIFDLDISSIYVEPFVNFNKNPATDEFTNVITVLKSSASLFNSSFVQGLTGSIAEQIWTVCHENYIRCKTINKPSENLTNLYWANGLQSGSIAEFSLNEFVNFFKNKEIEFIGHYNDFGDWEECHRYMVQFTKHTDNEQRQCIAEYIRVDPNPPYEVIVRGLMLPL